MNKKTPDHTTSTRSAKDKAASGLLIVGHSPKDVNLELQNKTLPEEEILVICANASPPSKTPETTAKQSMHSKNPPKYLKYQSCPSLDNKENEPTPSLTSSRNIQKDTAGDKQNSNHSESLNQEPKKNEKSQKNYPVRKPNPHAEVKSPPHYLEQNRK